MQRIIISMQNYVLGEAVERALKENGDFHVTVVEHPEETAEKCHLLGATEVLMEVTGYTPYKLAERMEIHKIVKKQNPDCKIILLVDENADQNLAESVKQAKKDGMIDQFIYGSTSASYLIALLDTL